MSASVEKPFYELRDALLEDVAAALERIRADRTLLDVRSGLGETLLHWFAVEYREDIVKALLDLGASVDPTNHFYSTPFAEAAQLQNQSMCSLLLKHGANVDPIDQNGQTPLMLAAFMGEAARCRFLLKLGASPTFTNSDGDSVLITAVRSGKIEVVEVIEVILKHLDSDTDINTQIDDLTASMLAEIASDITQLLQQRGLRKV